MKNLKAIILVFLIVLFCSNFVYARNARAATPLTFYITWTTVSSTNDLAGYNLYSSYDGRTYTKILTFNACATSIKIYNNSKYTTVYYYLVAFDTIGNVSVPSNIVAYKYPN